jgi:hypothetical protein
MTLMKPVTGRSGEEHASHVIVVVTVTGTFDRWTPIPTFDRTNVD